MLCIPALFFVGTHDIEDDIRFKIKATLLDKICFGLAEHNGFSLSKNLFHIYVFLSPFRVKQHVTNFSLTHITYGLQPKNVFRLSMYRAWYF